MPSKRKHHKLKIQPVSKPVSDTQTSTSRASGYTASQPEKVKVLSSAPKGEDLRESVRSTHFLHDLKWSGIITSFIVVILVILYLVLK